MNIFELVASKGVRLDDKHRYIYKNKVIDNSVTGIINKGRKFNSPIIQKYADFGTVIHSIIAKIIDGVSDLTEYDDDMVDIACYMFSKAIYSPHVIMNNGSPFVCSWNGNLIGGTPDLVTDTHIIELKTTKKSSKTHEKQLVCYMDALNRENGTIVYADPELPNIDIKKGTPRYRTLVKSILQDLNEVFEPPVKIVDEKEKEMEEFKSILDTLADYKEKIKTLELRKNQLTDRIIKRYNVESALEVSKKVCFPGFAISRVNTNAKVILWDEMKEDNVYNKYVQEQPSYYIKIIRGDV